MEEARAAAIVDAWSGSGGLVARGPKRLLGWSPVDVAELERHTGRRPPPGQRVWRLQVGGRFLRSGGLVYPGGVPFPEELRNETAVVSSEAWLYVTEAQGRVLGVHWWPEAVRRPIAAMPRDDFPRERVLPISEAAERLRIRLPVPSDVRWDPCLAVVLSDDEALVLCVRETLPDPLNEMLLYELGGLTLRVRMERTPRRPARLLDENQPPFRGLRVGGAEAIGREPGRALGPQTWPWPGELWWWSDGLALELKGFEPLAVLQDVAGSVTSP